MNLKEQLLKDALSCGCEDKKILAKIHNNLADCYETQGRIDEALSNYTTAAKYDLELAIAFISLGDLYKKLGKIEDAVKHYERGLSLLESKTIQDGSRKAEVIELKQEIDKLKINLKE